MASAAMATLDASLSSPNGDHENLANIKSHLQSLLDVKESQLQKAGTLGQRVLAQQMELEERIRQLNELIESDPHQDGFGTDNDSVKEQYKELVDIVRDWDKENEDLSRGFGIEDAVVPSLGAGFESMDSTPASPPTSTKPLSGSTSAAAQSRRAKNAAHRADDVEFAFEIGSGLLNEVRRLQSLLGERDKAIQDMKDEKDDLEAAVEGLKSALKEMEASADKFKEENWNLEVNLQELRQTHQALSANHSKLTADHNKLNKTLSSTMSQLEANKNDYTSLQNTFDDAKQKWENDMALQRKHTAGLQRDKSDLQQNLDLMKVEVEKAKKRIGRGGLYGNGSPATPRDGDDMLSPNDFLTPADAIRNDDPFSAPGTVASRRGGGRYAEDDDGEFIGERLDILNGEEEKTLHPLNDSYSAQPPAASPGGEVEALKAKLAMAQKQVATLKSALIRDRQKNKLGRTPGSGISSPFAGLGLGEHDDEEEVGEDAEAAAGKKKRLRQFAAGSGRGAARGRGRGGRGGISLTERFLAAAGRDEDEGDEYEHVDQEEVDSDEGDGYIFAPQEDEIQYDATGEELQQNTSVEGMDPAFANILRQSTAKGLSSSTFGATITDAGSPLRQSVLGKSMRASVRGRRGGAPLSQSMGMGRPDSLVGVPEDLGTVLGSLQEKEPGIDIGCQTELPQPVEKADMDIQTDPEVLPTPAVKESAAVQADLPVGPSPYPRSRKTTITPGTAALAGVAALQQYQSLTPPASALPPGGRVQEEDSGDETETGLETETETETDNETDYHDARQSATSLVTPSLSSNAGMPAQSSSERRNRSTAPPPSAFKSINTNVSRTPYGIPSASESSKWGDSDDFHSMMTMSENEYDSAVDQDDDDTQSVRAPQSTMPPMSPFPPKVYADTGTDARVATPPPILSIPVPQPVTEPPPPPPPAAEKKEMEVQTDAWSPPVPFPSDQGAVTPKATPSSPAFQRVANGPAQAASPSRGFTFIPHPGADKDKDVFGSPIGPSSGVFRESSLSTKTRKDRSMLGDRDRGTSIDSVIAASTSLPFDDEGPGNSTLKAPPVPDKTKPPSMIVPPPPKAPPPPGSMAPPAFIPERRAVTSMSTYSSAGPPGRPLSPPPAELLQRATTPSLFGSVIGSGLRPHGSSMPPPTTASNDLRQLSSVGSLRTSGTPGRREMSQTSLVSGGERSARSRSARSSMSSDQNPYVIRAQAQLNAAAAIATAQKLATLSGNGHAASSSGHPMMTSAGIPTDPAIIHAITQTMIGEFLYKYTRKTIGKGYGDKRHKRFFWVHPYTRTLYWSSSDPGSARVDESSAKSSYIDGVREILDPNPMPPGLHQYSVVVSTPQREMKFTAPTKERHDIWLNALKYLLSRPSPTHPGGPSNGSGVPDSPVSGEFSDDGHNGRNYATDTSPRSQRSVRGRPQEQFNTPRGQRSRSQISIGGSVGKRNGTPAAEYLRYGGSYAPESPYSPSRSFVDVQGFGNHMGMDDDDEENLDFELHDDEEDPMHHPGWEGLENVRACCDGKHTVGHHHHHHHIPGDLLPELEADQHPNRPVSPGAWSFRSRAASTTSHDGEKGGGMFSWSRASRKSTAPKASTGPQR